jgi:hypothetical protein
MPNLKALNGVLISAPQASTAVKINAARADAQFELTITAPTDTSAFLTVQDEIGPSNSGPWHIIHRLEGPHGGISPRTGTNNVYIWGGGVSQDMIGQWIRINFTEVSGTWTIDATLST